MRNEVIASIVRGLGAVASKRIGVTLGLCGDAGIGKTHAAARILGEVPCASHSLHAVSPAPQLIRALPRPPFLPVWAGRHLDRAARGEAVEPQALAGALAALLAGLAPFVLHLEDAHEADAERLELWVRLAHAVRRTPGVALLVTSRAELPAPFVSRRLPPLDALDGAALMQAELGAALPADGLAWVQARAGGHPLFTLEFTRYLTRQGFLWSDGQRWHWRAPPDDYVPVTVEALIARWIAGLGATPEVRAVLDARALLPGGSAHAVWASVAGVDPAALRHAIDTLTRAGLLRAAKAEFAHPLYGEVIARALNPERRRAMARAAFGALSADPTAAARFVKDADLPPGTALAAYGQAAVAARALGRSVEAARFTAAGVRHASGEARAALALDAARALAVAGLPEALEFAEVAASDRTGERWAEAEVVCVELLAARGHGAAAQRRVEALSAALSPERAWQIRLQITGLRGLHAEVLCLWRDHPEWQSRMPADVWGRIGSALARVGELGAADELARALLARTDLRPAEFQQARNLLGLVLQTRGEWAEVLEVERETITHARAFDDATFLGKALLNHASSLSSQGLRTGVPELIREACAVFDSLGLAVPYAVGLLRLANETMNDGRFEEAETLMTEAHAVLEQHDDVQWRTECHLKQARLYLDWQPPHGELLALRHARRALELARDVQDQKLLHSALVYAARAQARSGDPEHALRLAQDALHLAERHASAPRRADAQVACGLALEAGGQVQAGHAMVLLAHGAYLQLGERGAAERCGLEADRMTGDMERARVRRDWLLAAGLVGAASTAARYFPLLEDAGAPPVRPADELRLNVLGPVGVSRRGEAVVYRGRKRLELVCYLLEARVAGRPDVSALELLDALYPGEPEARARHTLKQQIYLIRSSLGVQSVLSTPRGYALGAVGSDAEDVLAGGDAALWRGAYLDGLGEGWFPGVRDALALALRARVEALLATDARAAARLAPVVCAMEPYSQGALALAVRALQAADDAPAARALYLERRAALLDVGEVLPDSPGAFLMAAQS